MIKKTLIAAAAVIGLGVLVFGTEALSYVTTYGRKVRQSVKDAVPPEFELERARQMVAALLPDIRQNMHVIAEEEVEVEHLQQAIASAGVNLGKEREHILALRNDLAGSGDVFRYAGQSYDRRQVKTELARRFERFKTAEATVASKRQILEARQKSLQAAREKLEGMIAAKRDLEVQVENLESRLKMVQAAQTSSQFQFDDSRLSRAKKLIGDLRKRLDVAQRMIDAEGRFVDVIPLEEPAPDDIVERVDEHFGKPAEGAQTAMSTRAS